MSRDEAELCESQRCAGIVDGILQASHCLRNILADYFSGFGLSDVRFAVLRILQDAEPGACTQSQLSALLNQSESSISTLIKRMRNSGLIYRLRSAEDKRKRVLKLTASGREQLQTVQQQHGRRMARLLRDLTPDEQRLLDKLLQKLRNILSSAEVPVEPVTEKNRPRSASAEYATLPIPPRTALRRQEEPAVSADSGNQPSASASADVRQFPPSARPEDWDAQSSAA